MEIKNGYEMIEYLTKTKRKIVRIEIYQGRQSFGSKQQKLN